MRASKEGYRSAEQKVLFGVIEKEPEIKEAKEEEIDFKIKTCKDEKCKIVSKEFLVGEKAYVNIESEVSELNVKAIVTLPDGTKKELELPGSIELKQEGSYIVEVSAEAEGYKKTTKIVEIVAKKEGLEGGQRVGFTEFIIIASGALALILLVAVVFYIRKKVT